MTLALVWGPGQLPPLEPPLAPYLLFSTPFLLFSDLLENETVLPVIKTALSEIKMSYMILRLSTFFWPFDVRNSDKHFPNLFEIETDYCWLRPALMQLDRCFISPTNPNANSPPFLLQSLLLHLLLPPIPLLQLRLHHPPSPLLSPTHPFKLLHYHQPSLHLPPPTCLLKTKKVHFHI